MKRVIASVTALALVTAPSHAQVGRQLDIITNPTELVFVDSIGAPFGVGEVVGIFWDERCAQVEYTFNTNRGANVGTASALTPAQLAQTIQDGLDRWNDNPASYIEMNITQQRDLGLRTRQSLDFINEVTFITAANFTALASSPSTSLLADATFVAGDDIDGDGDSDVFDPVAAGVNKCTDIDSDGDIEFPAGDYKAGTILDNDVQFSSRVAWSLEASDSGTADVDAVSTHEFGHSHGLNHSLINQISASDGNGSTMFPFIDTTDGAAEAATRSPHIDDFAVSSFIYPEGSSATGIAALQPGDQDFDDVYDIIRGEVTQNGGPVLGAHVSASIRNSGEVVSGTYSGHSVAFFDVFGVIQPGGIFAFPESAVDGEWELAVPRGTVYRLAVEALDGDPAATSNISTNAIIGGILGQNVFPEEFQNGNQESGVELAPGQATPVFSGNATGQNVGFATNQEVIQTNAGPLNFIGTGLLATAINNFTYAEAYDRSDVLAILDAGNVPVSALFRTGTLDSSRVPTFSKAQLAVGYANANGTATIKKKLAEQRDFIGQESDSTPFYFNNPNGLAQNIRNELLSDANLQLFLVLEATDLTPGPSGFPAAFLALDSDVSGTSYQSIDGSPLTLRSGTWLTQLRYVSE